MVWPGRFADVGLWLASGISTESCPHEFDRPQRAGCRNRRKTASALSVTASGSRHSRQYRELTVLVRFRSSNRPRSSRATSRLQGTLDVAYPNVSVWSTRLDAECMTRPCALPSVNRTTLAPGLKLLRGTLADLPLPVRPSTLRAAPRRAPRLTRGAAWSATPLP